MKKAGKIICAVLIALAAAFFSFRFLLTRPGYTGVFSVSDFEEYTENENFRTGSDYGPIPDWRSAAAAGKAAIADRFENSEGSIFEWMGCTVRYDEENDAYEIRTYHVFPIMFGGAYDVILKSDGTVLAIWGEK